MFYIFIASVLFGLVHPGSKLILDSGLDLVSFCLLYVGIRIAVQACFVAYAGQWRIGGRALWATLLLLGLVGAALQLSEFKGIANGLPVPLVTFLVYSHPVWSSLLSRFINGEPLTRESWLKLSSGVLGILCITGAEVTMTNLRWQSLVAPLFAGLLIGLWVSLSHRAKKLGASSLTVSFYYDLFAFAALLTIAREAHVDQTRAWLMQSPHALAIAAYSVVAGLMPNLLFYRGSAKITARAAGLILLVEPVIATIASYVLWHDQLSRFFYVGVVLVLVAGCPTEIWTLGWLSNRLTGKYRQQARVDVS